MDSQRFLSVARSLGYRPVQVLSCMSALGFACSDNSVQFVRGWQDCVEPEDKCFGKLTVSDLLSCYHDLYRGRVYHEDK